MLGLLDGLMKVNKKGKIVADYMEGKKLSLTHSMVFVRNKKNLQSPFMLETHQCHLKNYMTNFLIMHESFLKWEEANKGIPPITAQFN